MTTKKVSDLEEDYKPGEQMFPVEQLIFVIVFLIGVFFVLTLAFR